MWWDALKLFGKGLFYFGMSGLYAWFGVKELNNEYDKAIDAEVKRLSDKKN